MAAYDSTAYSASAYSVFAYDLGLVIGKGIASKRGRKPRTRKVTIRSASHALAGPELPYPVYHFSNRIFIERPGHNPFKGL